MALTRQPILHSIRLLLFQIHFCVLLSIIVLWVLGLKKLSPLLSLACNSNSSETVCMVRVRAQIGDLSKATIHSYQDVLKSNLIPQHKLLTFFSQSQFLLPINSFSQGG